MIISAARLARVGNQIGYHSKAGGWIYNKFDSPVSQGWHTMRPEIARHLTKKYTAFDCFTDLVAAPYTPTLRVNAGNRSFKADMRLLADLYDNMQRRLGSNKRAFRA
jgi:hypothetical protein